MLPVESGIPIPKMQTRETIYPWVTLEVGQSFFAPSPRNPGGPSKELKATGRTFTTRKVEGGIRVWRTA